ncbi:glutathione peroxidase [Roseiterribacter gracilis]|uniref:Glutathione peroxidase n=1 Tax=Roseiterribacter gracilis TaxID=2812848 RepID=A0A8S8X8Q4_9PROT|nr:glutathione peroxidase [Rhodospirillales bacterium TMPK1]
MRIILTSLLASLVAIAIATGAKAESAFDFQFTSIDGKPMPLSAYKGKTLLIVNTASQCGYTPQYADLEKTWAKYRDKGLIVIGVPSNDFGGQEPGSEADIKKFCEANYDIDFPLTTKNVVKGADAHPFYKWAGLKLGEPKWNFHKYVIAPDGTLAGSFNSKVKPDAPELVQAIEGSLPKT